MPKKAQDPEINDLEPTHVERAPPLLSEEGIAKLQAAVDAARRKRLAPNNPPPDPDHGE